MNHINEGPIMMTRTEYRKPVKGPRTTCHSCGKLVDLSSKNALVETPEDGPSKTSRGVAWHQDCFNRFLDQGEEC